MQQEFRPLPLLFLILFFPPVTLVVSFACSIIIHYDLTIVSFVKNRMFDEDVISLLSYIFHEGPVYFVKYAPRSFTGGGAIIWIVGFPLLFVLFPETVKKARVKTSHLVRIDMYSMLVPLMAGFAVATYYFVRLIISFIADGTPWYVAESMQRFIPGDPDYFLGGFYISVGKVIIFIIVALWTATYWYFACRNYLRLPQPGLTVLLLFLVLGLISVLMILFSGLLMA